MVRFALPFFSILLRPFVQFFHMYFLTGLFFLLLDNFLIDNSFISWMLLLCNLLTLQYKLGHINKSYVLCTICFMCIFGKSWNFISNVEWTLRWRRLNGFWDLKYGIISPFFKMNQVIELQNNLFSPMCFKMGQNILGIRMYIFSESRSNVIWYILFLICQKKNYRKWICNKYLEFTL